MKHEPIDWDIIFALMECYGMLKAPIFPSTGKRKRKIPLRKANVR